MLSAFGRTEKITKYKEPIVVVADIQNLVKQVRHKPSHIQILINYQDAEFDIISELDEKYTAHVFTADELRVSGLNTSEKIRYATEKEIDALVLRHIDMQTLPKMHMRDIIRRLYNFKKGEVVAIERPNKKLYYRRIF